MKGNNKNSNNQWLLICVVAIVLGVFLFMSAPSETTYTDDLTNGKTFSASSIHNSDYDASKAFSDDGSYWITGSGQPSANQWIKVDFGNDDSKTIKKITITGRYEMGFNSFILQGSTDNFNWDNVYTGTGSSSESTTSFTFSNNNEYQYYRVYCVSGYNPTTLRVTEIEMMETEIV